MAGEPSKGVVLAFPEGTTVPLPASLVDLVRVTAVELANGRGVTVLPADTVVTPAEAAELLGLSRPFVVRLLDDGVIASERLPASRHRRIRLDDVLAFAAQREKRREGAGVSVTPWPTPACPTDPEGRDGSWSTPASSSRSRSWTCSSPSPRTPSTRCCGPTTCWTSGSGSSSASSGAHRKRRHRWPRQFGSSSPTGASSGRPTNISSTRCPATTLTTTPTWPRQSPPVLTPS